MLINMNRILAVFATVWVALIGVPVAHAAQGNLVSFGDSYMANPPLAVYAQDKVDAQSSGGGIGSCPTATDNFPKRAAAKLGLSAHDYSCSGATAVGDSVIPGQGHTVGRQIDAALADGTLSADTRRVIMSLGFNDAYGTAPGFDDRFTTAMLAEIDRIRGAAPNARIQFVGYPTITDGNNVCLLNAHGVQFRVWLPQVRSVENDAQHMQQRLTREADVEFIDLKPATRDRHMCAPDHQRYWMAVIDSQPSNLPYHMQRQGHEFVAEAIARS